MSFQKKSYEEIVEDIVERITKGSSREKYDNSPGQVRFKLANTPVKSIIKVEGLLRGARHVFVRGRDYRQIGAMLEWSPSGDRPDDSTSFFVNYTFDEPSGITDVNPGSVVRTIVEAIAREINLLYEEMSHVYDAGFIDTANGKALEMVVSLLGKEFDRTPPQSATAHIVFGRASEPEKINVDNEVRVFDGNPGFKLKVQPVSRVLALKGSKDSKPSEFKEGEDFVLEENAIRWVPGGKLPDENSSFTVSYVAHQRIVVPKGVTVTTSSPDPKKVRAFDNWTESGRLAFRLRRSTQAEQGTSRPAQFRSCLNRHWGLNMSSTIRTSTQESRPRPTTSSEPGLRKHWKQLARRRMSRYNQRFRGLKE